MSATESKKKKRRAEEEENRGGGGGLDSGKRAMEGGVVTDREVDEFFAILRRMHAAAGYVKQEKGANGDGRELTEKRPGSSGVTEKTVASEVEAVEENAGFDLNADPLPEPDPF